MYERSSDRVVCERFNFDVVDSTVTRSDGATFGRSWARHEPTVATVAVTSDRRVPLIRQYRAAIDADNLELPGGRIDATDGEPSSAAVRELEQEVGVRAAAVTPLGSFLNSPGHCSQRTLLFLAEDLTDTPRDLDAEEESTSQVQYVDLADVDGLIARGDVQDAKSIIGLLLAARRLGV
ncbi:NUDIX domain-containing protein [Geodermatophilus sp. SYSU D00705]